MVRGDVSSWKESPFAAEFARPPMLVGAVCYRDHVSATEFQLALLLQNQERGGKLLIYYKTKIWPEKRPFLKKEKELG